MQIETLQELLRSEFNVDMDYLMMRGRYVEMEEIRSSESVITMNMSLVYEELSRKYESMGRYSDALQPLVNAGEHLFDRNCSMLNSLMGYGHPLAERLYELEHRCKELCNRHPELWEEYNRNSVMKYLLERQHLWPCE